MHRFFITADNIKNDVVVISGDDAVQINRVLRLGVGDLFAAIDPVGKEYIVEISLVSDGKIAARIIRKVEPATEPSIEVVLLQGLPKGDKMDFVVQKSTELGVKVIVPVVTERTIVKLDVTKADARRQRWQRIAEEAAEQSGRTFIPLVGEVLPLAAALERLSLEGLPIVAWEEEHAVGLKRLLRNQAGVRRVILLVGPEGGLSTREVGMARQAGFVPVSLGPRILRTETAGITALTMVLYELDDLGG